MIKKIQKGLNAKKTIVLSGNCRIEYSGRAEAKLPLGDRIIIIKKDRTLLVHQPEGSAPINYMRKETHHTVRQGENGLIIESKNSDKEHLVVELNTIHFVQILDLVDGRKQVLAGNEKDMSDMLYNNPEMVEEGFVPLNREEHTKYGFIDVFGHDKNGILTIVECKRYKADLSAVTQLRRYVEKIKKSKGIKRVRGIIAAAGITENALAMLNDWGFKFIEVVPPKRLIIDKSQQQLEGF